MMVVTAKFEGVVRQGVNAGRSVRSFGPFQPRNSVVLPSRLSHAYPFTWMVRFAGVYF